MSHLWARADHGAEIMDADELRDIADPDVVEDGDVAAVFDTGSEDGAIIYATTWADLAEGLEAAARKVRKRAATLDCAWEFDGVENADETLYWWNCTTHGKTEMGSDPDEDPTNTASFPCEHYRRA